MKRIEWIKTNLGNDAKVMVNFRDFTDAMIHKRELVLKIAYFLSALPLKKRPFGLMYEEPTGNVLPSQLGVWTSG